MRYRDSEQLIYVILKALSYVEDRYIPGWIIHQIISGFRPSLLEKLEVLTDCGLLDKTVIRSLRLHTKKVNYYRITEKGKAYLIKFERLAELIPEQFKPSNLQESLLDAKKILKQTNHRAELLAVNQGDNI
jgi:hypothetical protein